MNAFFPPNIGFERSLIIWVREAQGCSFFTTSFVRTGGLYFGATSFLPYGAQKERGEDTSRSFRPSGGRGLKRETYHMGASHPISHFVEQGIDCLLDKRRARWRHYKKQRQRLLQQIHIW